MVFSFAASCQRAGLSLANAANDESHFTHESGVTYASESWQTLDIYTPKGEAGKAPTVLFFYGGGWTGGAKEDYAFVANRLTQEGYAVVISDYRKYPEARYPDFQLDAALATRWIVDHAEQYQLDAGVLFIMGHSAGAHIGAMLIADASYLAAQSLNPSVFAGFIGIAGPYHFSPEEETYKQIFGPPENYLNMQMTHFIDGSEPPILLQHGMWDSIVGKVNIERLEPALKEHSNDYTVKYYPQATHLSIIGAYSNTLPLHNSVVKDALAFMKEVREK